MTPQEFQAVGDLFERVRALHPAERERELAVHAPAGSPLRAEIDSLLLADSRGGEFLDRPLVPEGSASELADSALRDSAADSLGDGAALVGTRVGSYDIVRVIGSGGMGVVYEARQETPARTVALKIMKAGLASAAARRLRAEADALARLHHPAIAQIYDAGTHATPLGPVPYLVMEYVPDAENIVAAAGRLGMPRRRCLELFAEICDALHHAHQRGVIHRDLKPANILLDAAGRPKVIDFGVVRLTGEPAARSVHTRTGQLVGTLAYMSPEQLTGDAGVDTRADVYALGAVLYELLAGRPAHRTDELSIPEATVRVLGDEPPTLGTLDRTLRGDLERIVAKAMAKERGARYASASEFAADIRRHLHDEPVLARPPGTAEQLRRFARRHRGLVGALASGAAVLVTATAVLAVLSYRLHKAEQRAIAERNAAAAARDSEESHRKTLEQIVTFLQTTLASANPDDGRLDMTVLEALARASAQAEEQLADRPLVRGRVQVTIAEVYKRLARYDDAERLARAALASFESFDSDALPEDRARAELCLANVLRVRGSSSQAREFAQHALAILDAPGAPPSLTAAEALNTLGEIVAAEGRYPQAADLHRRALAARRELLPEESTDIGGSLNNLANALYWLGDAPAAEEHWRQAVRIFEHVHGTDHPTVATGYSNLSLALGMRGRHEVAAAMARRALEIRTATLPADHPQIADAHEKLGSALGNAGQIDEGLRHCAEALRLRRATLGTDHPAIAATLANTASILIDAGRNDDARPMLDESLAIVRTKFGDDHPTAAGPLMLLGLVETRAGRPAHAEPMLRKALELRTRQFGAGQWRTANAASALGECLLAQGRLDESGAVLSAAHEILVAALPPENEQVCRSHERLARWRDAARNGAPTSGKSP